MALACAMAIVVVGWYAEATPAKAGAKTDGKTGGADPAAVQCKKDQDCVAVPDDCCSCTSGGRLRALPRREKKLLRKRTQEGV